MTRWEESSDHPTEPPLDDEHGEDGEDGEVEVDDQDCAICGAPQADWSHRLDSAQVEYRAWGSGYTLPSSWTLCEACESLHQAGDVAGLVVRRAAHARANDRPYEGRIAGRDVVEEDFRKPIEVFVRADLGGRRLR